MVDSRRNSSTRSDTSETSPQLLIHSQIRKSPYWELSKKAGCHTYTVLSNTYHPRGYFPDADGGLLREHDQICHGAGIWDEAPDRQIAIRGPDALAFADYLVTRDLWSRLPVGRACYALVCDESGGIVGDPVVLRIAHDEIWLSGNIELLHFAKGVRVHSDYNISIDELDVAPIHVHGPKTAEILRRLVDAGHLEQRVLELDRFEFCHTHLGSLPVITMRMQLLDSPTYEFYPLNSSINGPRVWEGLVDKGGPYGLAVTSPPNIRRIEAGIKFYHSEMNHETSPYEVGLDWQVQFRSRPFVGRSALERIQAEGVSRKLVGIRYRGAPVTHYNPEPWPIFLRGGNDQIGTVTSTLWSPACEANIGYAFVPVDHVRPATGLLLYRPDYGQCDAEVARLPFVG